MGVLDRIRFFSDLSGLMVQHQVALLLPLKKLLCLSAGKNKTGLLNKLKRYGAAPLHEHQGAPHSTLVAGELG